MDGNWSYWGIHCIISKSIESLSWTPGTNILYVNYNSIKRYNHKYLNKTGIKVAKKYLLF